MSTARMRPSPRRSNSRLLPLLLLAPLLGGCSWTLNTDVALNQESWRTNAVVSRQNTTLLVVAKRKTSMSLIATYVASQIAHVSEVDRIYCPAGGIPGCDTTSEYVRKHPSDLSGAIASASRTTTCVALTVLAPYNWTTKGHSNGCFG